MSYCVILRWHSEATQGWYRSTRMYDQLVVCIWFWGAGIEREIGFPFQQTEQYQSDTNPMCMPAKLLWVPCSRLEISVLVWSEQDYICENNKRSLHTSSMHLAILSSLLARSSESDITNIAIGLRSSTTSTLCRLPHSSWAVFPEQQIYALAWVERKQ